MNCKKNIFLFLFLQCLLSISYGQKVTVKGVVKGNGETLISVNIVQKNTKIATVTNDNGEYALSLNADRRATLLFTYVGYKPYEYELLPLEEGAILKLDVTMVEANTAMEVTVTARRIEEAGMIRERVNNLKLLPSASGNFESVLPSIALGTNAGSGGELSSQYNVRGGNYDENLVYVNDFEIYRPQLIRAGQQEGLSFPNIDLIRDLAFSSGGFEARYGDKLSSVLDIKYKRPDSIRASVVGSFLGGSVHLEGSKKLGAGNYRRFRYLLGARYKTTRYLLGSLDIKGEYVPDFTDVQTYMTYDVNRNWQLAFLGNYNNSVFNFTPKSGNTEFGLINFALKLSTLYEGSERDAFRNGMSGISLSYIPEKRRNPLYIKFLASTFLSDETERIDIIGKYSLGEVQTNLGADNFGDVVAELGAGTQQQFVRNSLQTRVSNVEHKGGIEFPRDNNGTTTSSHFVQWSIKGQNEVITDKLKEWERLDSALYSLNYDTTKLNVFEYFKTANALNSNRLSAFVQNTYSYKKSSRMELQATVGVRATYWDLNKELNISPRVQLLLKPLNVDNERAYRLSAGYYVQPPFYRELRNTAGIVNENVQAQKSFHVVAGFQQEFYLFKSQKRFKFISEAYYKKMWDLVSYDVENVRIRYAGINNANGYAYGADLRINGEFVPGAESWVNFSFLRTKEQLDGVQHQTRKVGEAKGTNVDFVPRPSERFFNTSIFFQDYLRNNNNFKVHTNFTVGTGLPYGLPNNNIVFRNPYRLKAYHRVDIGFSYLLYDKAMKDRRPKHFLRFTRSSWLSLEVFNLMEVANEANKTWIKTIFKQQYAIPNYLTSRRVNLRLRMEF